MKKSEGYSAHQIAHVIAEVKEDTVAPDWVYGQIRKIVPAQHASFGSTTRFPKEVRDALIAYANEHRRKPGRMEFDEYIEVHSIKVPQFWKDWEREKKELVKTKQAKSKPVVDSDEVKILRKKLLDMGSRLSALEKRGAGAEFQLTGKVEDTTASDVRTQGKQIRALFAKLDDLQKAVWSAAQTGDRNAESVAREGMHETSRQLYRHIMDRQCGYTDMRLDDIESWLVAEIKKRRDMPDFIRDQTMEAYFVRNHKKYAHDIEWLLDVHRCQVEDEREEREQRN